MKNKSTLKRRKRFRRNTRKNSKYGGMIRASTPLSASAPAWTPSQSIPASQMHVPLPQMEITPEMAILYRNVMRIMNNKVVAIDCEMVGVGPGGRESALAHVAIVDLYGNQIYNEYVIPRGGINSITDDRFAYSGITKKLLEHKNSNAKPFEVVKSDVQHILNDKTIVGHGLVNDFKVLEYVPDEDSVWDTTVLDGYTRNHPDNIDLPVNTRRKQAKKLKVLAKEIANNNIQMGHSGHSPLEDARASMNLFRIANSLPKMVYKDMAVA